MIQHLLRLLGLKYISSWLILAMDILVSSMATLIAFLLIRGLFSDEVYSMHFGLLLVFVSCLASLFAFYCFRTFRSVIRHATLREVWKLCAAVLAKTGILALYIFFLPVHYTAVASVTLGLILDGLLTLFMLVSVRIVMIAMYDLLKMRFSKRDNCKRVMIYGTDEKQIALTVRLQNSPHYQIAGFLTYGQQLKRYTIAEKPVYYFEDTESITYLIHKTDLDAVLFATYDDAQGERERLILYCIENGVQVLIAPPIDEVIDGKLMKQSVREIKIEDLLGRPEINISLDEIHAHLHGKTILVTGAAGSIGSFAGVERDLFQEQMDACRCIVVRIPGIMP